MSAGSSAPSEMRRRRNAQRRPFSDPRTWRPHGMICRRSQRSGSQEDRRAGGKASPRSARSGGGRVRGRGGGSRRGGRRRQKRIIPPADLAATDGRLVGHTGGGIGSR